MAANIVNYLSIRYQGKDTPYPYMYRRMPITNEDRMWDNYYHELQQKGCISVLNLNETPTVSFGSPYHESVWYQISKFIDLYNEGFNIIEYTKEDIALLVRELRAIPTFDRDICTRELHSDSRCEILQRFLRAYNTICRRKDLALKRSTNVWNLEKELYEPLEKEMRKELENPAMTEEQFRQFIKSRLSRIEEAAMKCYRDNVLLRE